MSLSHLRSTPKNILLAETTQGHPPQPALDPEPIWEPTVLLTGLIFHSHGTEKGGLGSTPSLWVGNDTMFCLQFFGREENAIPRLVSVKDLLLFD